MKSHRHCLTLVLPLSLLALLLLSALSVPCSAQNSPISGLSLDTSPAGTDQFILQKAGETRAKRTTRSALLSGLATTTSPALTWAIYASDPAYGVSPSASAATNDAGLTAAIAALPAAGGFIFLPCGAISISATVTLGNATTTTASTRNGITIIGCGTGTDGINLTATSSATSLVWAGSAGGRMVEIHGPIEGVSLRDFTLDGAGLAAQLIHSYRAFQQDIRRMNLIRWTGTAIAIDADGTYTGAGGGGGGGAPFQQTWELVNVINPSSTAANAVAIGSNVNGNYNVNEVTFTRCQLERGNTDNAYSLWLGNVDHAAFLHTWMLRRGATTGKAIIVAPQSGAPTWPSNITFVASPLEGGVYLDQSAATWSNSANPALLFYPFYTADSQAIPPVGAISTTLPATLVGGMTDTGMPLSGSQARISLTSNQGMSANQEALGNNGILFEGATPDAFETFLTVTDPTADRTITLKDASGTLAFTTDTAPLATSLAANGANCSAGTFPLGIDASGAAESCTALPVTIAGTANQIAASAATGAITLSIPTNPTLPGTTTGTFSGPLTGNASTATALAADPADCSANQAANGINASGTATGCLSPAILAGISGGQTLNGDTGSGGNLTLSSTANATKGKILFGTSAYDHANNRLGIGTASPDVQLTVSGNAAAIPASPATTRFHLAGADAESATRMLIDVFGTASTPIISGRKSRGTAASPSAIQAGDVLLQLEGLGYETTLYSTFSRAAILFEASQNWTDSVQGTRETHYLTPTGGTSNVNVWRIDGDSHVTTTQGTAPTISCTGTGTSPSAPVVDGTDHAFRITINTGTGSPGSTGTCTVTFKTVYATNAPVLVCSLVSGASAWGNGATIQETTESASAPVLTFTNLVGGVATALTVSTSYKVNCIALGR